jgi:5-methylcytosine-specific restriction endonuclease McrA
MLRDATLRRDNYTCIVPGCRARATRVDHIKSRRDGGLDSLRNLRSLCTRHDNQIKEDARGKRRSDGKPYVLGCDVRGRPLDPSHWWNRKIAQS